MCPRPSKLNLDLLNTLFMSCKRYRMGSRKKTYCFYLDFWFLIRQDTISTFVNHQSNYAETRSKIYAKTLQVSLEFKVGTIYIPSSCPAFYRNISQWLSLNFARTIAWQCAGNLERWKELKLGPFEIFWSLRCSVQWPCNVLLCYTLARE